MTITEHSSPFEARRRYVRPPQPIHFPVSEEMPETNRHMELRTALYQILKYELESRATLGSDQFIYYDPTTAKKKLAPDTFVKLGQPHATFRVWKTWLRGAPEVAVEVVSDSDEGDEDWAVKLERYRAAGIGEVVRFDPDDSEQPIRVWDHVDGDLVERQPSPDGAVECGCLGLYWVAVPHPSFVRILRLARDRAGLDLLPTPVEAEARARQEETRARQQAERARQEEMRARQEEMRARQQAERAREESERARQEEMRAREESERARQEEMRARQESESARQEAEQARDRLHAQVAELQKKLLEQESAAKARPQKAPSVARRAPQAAAKNGKAPKK